MTIVNPINHIPRAVGGVLLPSRNPFVVDALAEEWERQYREAGRDTKLRAIPDAGPYRGSMASKRCDRALYYALLRELNPPPEPPVKGGYGDLSEWERAENEHLAELAEWVEQYGETNPPELSDQWTFWLGQIVHEAIQPVVLAMYPGAAEALHDLRAIDIPGSSHSDLAITADIEGHATLVEIKTINGFSYKMIATNFQGPAQGPRYGAVLQAAMAAAAEGIERIVIVYLSLERVSPNLAWSADSEAARFTSEWHFKTEELLPQIQAESARINDILDMAQTTELGLPTRRLRDPDYPDGAVVKVPLQAKAPWTVEDGDIVADTGTTWMCGYCHDRDRCMSDGA